MAIAVEQQLLPIIHVRNWVYFVSRRGKRSRRVTVSYEVFEYLNKKDAAKQYKISM